MSEQTLPLFRDEPYARSAQATVLAVTEDGLVLDRTVFYAAGGGQPGDIGEVRSASGHAAPVTDTRYSADRSAIVHIVADADAFAPGDTVQLALEWARRHRHMRMHTALHLLSVALPYPVTGGQIGAEESRLDFDIPDAGLDRDQITAAVNAFIAADHPVSAEWITDAELDAKPELVKTMSVKPPRGSGRIRLIRIGDTLDLQPCGGTHVARTGEIGPVEIAKIEKKGRQNRRVRLRLSQG